MVLSNYIVGFIDVLGQREAFNQSPKIIQELNNPKGFINDTYGKVEKLKVIIENLKDGWVNSPYEFIKAAGHTIPDVNYSRFSDSLEIHSSMISKTGKELPLASIFFLLMACSGISLFSLAAGFAVRGGLTIGIGIENEQKSIYGPALYEAVVMEEDCAIYPRIMISNELLKYIDMVNKIEPFDEKGKVDKAVAEKCFEYIEEINGEYFVSFLSKKMLEIYSPKEKDEITNRVRAFVENQIGKYNQNPKILSKYQWIVDYDNQRDSILKL